MKLSEKLFADEDYRNQSAFNIYRTSKHRAVNYEGKNFLNCVCPVYNIQNTKPTNMRKLFCAAMTAGCFIFLFVPSYAQKKSPPVNNDALKTLAMSDIQAKYDDYKKIALQIWDYAEVGYKETKSSAL